MKWLIFISLIPGLTIAQEKWERLVDSLRFVSEVPYACEATGMVAMNDSPVYNIGCGDRIFWEVVQGKNKVIELLIDKLADTTQTDASVSYFAGKYSVADVAYVALQEIVKGIPTFDLLGVQFDKDGCGYCSYWTYLREDTRNRQKFRVAVQGWYDKNKTKFVWVKSDNVLTFDLSAFKHPNGGHYEVIR